MLRETYGDGSFHMCLQALVDERIEEKRKLLQMKKMTAVQKFKKKLRWDDRREWFDHGGVGTSWVCSDQQRSSMLCQNFFKC